MNTSLPRVARLADVVAESSKVRTLILDLGFEADPGQFVMVWLPGVDEKPFSLVRADPITLTIARVGPFTTELVGLEPGHALWIRGPLGRPFSLPASPIPGRRSPILVIAGGYGVAPLHFLAERALDAGWPVAAIIGAQTADEVVLAERFQSLGAGVVVTTDDGSLGERGMATDAADRLLGGGHYEAIYACGPEPMLEAVETLAQKWEVPAQLSYERYMRCGFGVCGSCARQGWLVCRDGPVKQVPPRL